MGLFHRHGYDAVGVAELSRAMGVKPPSLYAAFGSKQGLFERAVARYRTRQGAFVQEMLSQPGKPEDLVSRLFARAAEVYSADRERPGCLVADGARNCADQAICDFVAGLKADSRQFMVDRLRREFPEADYPGVAECLAEFIAVVLGGLSAAARDGVPREALAQTAAMAAAGFRAACPAKPGSSPSEG